MKEYLQINPKDNVAVIMVDTENENAVPRGHKIALTDIPEGEFVIKYGFPIGIASKDIAKGEWVHSHNLKTGLGENLEYRYEPVECPKPESSETRIIQAYQRKNGDIGIRNDLWVLPTVGCINGSAKTVAELLKKEAQNLPEIDDVIAFTHNYGCSQLGDDHANTRKAIAALTRHPNAGGVIVLGLGCENNKMEELKKEIGEWDPERVKFIIAQDVKDEIEEGVKAGKEILEVMSHDSRTPVPASRLKVGLKCGGSDGLSGITANPLIGLFADRLASWGGSVVLTEVPEMFGAETILMNRAASKEIFDDEVNLINDFKDYFRKSGMPIYENPSPGNKAGGITTLEEKSLGCVQKGGHSPVVDVLKYGEKITKPGLSLLNAPGNDLVASTALAISGCHMVLFSTGRGTPFGTCVPTLKIATNNGIASRKPQWIDFSAGSLAEGEDPQKALDEFTSLILNVANGEKTKQEKSQNKEIAIFKTGVTL